MRGILSDHDIEGHFRALVTIWETEPWYDLWEPIMVKWNHRVAVSGPHPFYEGKKYMGNESKQIATNPHTDRKPMCDDDILQLLADQRGRSITELVSHFHVTMTAIRNRLIRLASARKVTRKLDAGTRRRGRPKYLYFITLRDADIGQQEHPDRDG